jgi:hypothetical protein
VRCKISSLILRDIVSYAQVPGVRDNRGSGIGREGRGLPVFGHVVAARMVNADTV